MSIGDHSRSLLLNVVLASSSYCGFVWIPDSAHLYGSHVAYNIDQSVAERLSEYGTRRPAYELVMDRILVFLLKVTDSHCEALVHNQMDERPLALSAHTTLNYQNVVRALQTAVTSNACYSRTFAKCSSTLLNELTVLTVK